MNVSVTCPHCKRVTDIWLDGITNIFDCSHCGNAFSYHTKPPAPPPQSVLPSPPHIAQPTQPVQIIINSDPHRRDKIGFGGVFRLVTYVCISLFILMMIGCFGVVFLNAIAKDARGFKPNSETDSEKRWIACDIRLANSKVLVKNLDALKWDSGFKMTLDEVYTYRFTKPVSSFEEVSIDLEKFTDSSGKRFYNFRKKPTVFTLEVNGYTPKDYLP